MTTDIYHADEDFTIYHGDCRTVMSEMESESVHCVITSPPYWGLRDYGTATWIGGDADCDHRGPPRQSAASTLAGNGHGNGKPLSPYLQAQSVPIGRLCPRCGAARQDSQLGLERTPEEYVANLVAVFREVRRVLRKDGTAWLNLGDTYVGARAKGGLKPKDLAGIPWRVALALQSDGWYLRSDIIWYKRNPIPESVTDRPTKSHEYLFLLSRSPRYYFDQDAVREDPAGYRRKGGSALWTADSGHTNGIGSSSFHQMSVKGRNIRSVWTTSTAPYPSAHFATFPPQLIEPCAKAGCPKGGIILDPFAGSGTVGQVAKSLGRKAVLIELSAKYLTVIGERLGLPVND